MTLYSPALGKIPLNKKSRRESAMAKISSASPGTSNNNITKNQQYEIVAVLESKKEASCGTTRIITRDDSGKLYCLYGVKSFIPKKKLLPEFNYIKAIVEKKARGKKIVSTLRYFSTVKRNHCYCIRAVSIT